MRNLHEPQLFVVVGSDPFGRIDRAFFQGGINIGGRKLLRHHAEPGEHLTGDAADPELQTFEVTDDFDLFAEPSPSAVVLPNGTPSA
jgi:hypothetical protein